MTKDVWNMLTIWSAFSFILVVLFRSRTCDNALENHGRNEERTFFIFMSTKAVWSSWQEREHHWFSHGAVAGRWGQSQDQDFYEYNRQRSNIFQPSNIFQDSTSSNALHMTLLHPPTPKPPPSVNNNGTCNVATSSNQATSSRIQHHPTHSTWRYYTPPHPPICIQERPFWYSIKTEGSSKLRGTPSLEPIYIYYITLNIVWYSVDVSLDEIRIHHQLAQVTLMSSCWVLQSLRTLHAGILQDPERRSPLLCLGNGTHATAWGMVTK